MSAPAPVARLAVAPKAESAQVMGSMADESPAKLSKRAPVAVPGLEEGLQEIVNLRAAGQSKAADEKLLALHQRFPEEDLPALLEALQKAHELIAGIGYPANKAGQYDKDGDWNFGGSVEGLQNADDLKSAFGVIGSAIANATQQRNATGGEG